jgi:membrane protein DedA with SNARE-associated domain
MKKNNLPAPVNERPRPLWGEILNFSRKKYILAFILVLLGLLGIVVPVIPGLLLLLFAAALLKPGLMKKVRAKLNNLFK